MTSIFIRGASSKRPVIVAALAFGAAVLAAQPAAAQRAEAGPYGVARAGVSLDSDLRLGNPRRPATTPTRPGTPTTTPTPVPASPLGRKVDADLGFAGEVGAGYDFGGFRLEGTVGYGSASVNEGRLSDRTTVGDGRLKSLDLGIAGYVDFNAGGVVKPFIGGGIGASRVSAEVSRLARTTTTTTTPRPNTPTTPALPRAGTSIDRDDWGFRWHLDAGLGYEVSPGTTLELAGRYARTTSLDMASSTRTVTGTTVATTTAAFKPRLSSTSLTLGLRQRF